MLYHERLDVYQDTGCSHRRNAHQNVPLSRGAYEHDHDHRDDHDHDHEVTAPLSLTLTLLTCPGSRPGLQLKHHSIRAL